MSSNVVSIPFGDITASEEPSNRDDIIEFMGEVNQWCEDHGADTNSERYKHLASVIMAQLHVILMKAE